MTYSPRVFEQVSIFLWGMREWRPGHHPPAVSSRGLEKQRERKGEHEGGDCEGQNSPGYCIVFGFVS